MDSQGRYRAVRAQTTALASHLAVDDQLAQSMDDASPTKWHLAHTTWFFERFVLGRASAHDYLWNSYYEGVGARHPRPRRALITRPTLEEVHAYRSEIDEAVVALLARAADPERATLVELGCQHEEQHQELLLTDAKHALFCSPLRPAYRPFREAEASAPPLEWLAQDGGVREIGHAASGDFAFDNETPRHRVFVEPFAIASRTVTNGEFRAFVDDGGYRRPELWVSDGWGRACADVWQLPLYWSREGGALREHTLGGTRGLEESEPVTHVSWYEADAYARWADARLPTEAEWELAAEATDERPHEADDPRHHPRPARAGVGMREALGSVWEWTASAYVPYPRYRPPAGVLGEYNGKFMSGQMILRGGSCLTPKGHSRRTYRNFFQPDKRWQMTGIRLARWS